MIRWVLLCWSIGAVCAENWPCWRGPRMDGSSLETGVPVRWSTSENVRWKAPVPGHGYSSPIVWEDRIFLLTAALEDEGRKVLCLNRHNGNLLWEKTVVTAPLERKHFLNSYASSTAATDGTNVYVSFLDQDQMLVAAYDMQGKQRWLVRPGPFSSIHGFCSSPVLYQDKVILNGDHDGDSYILALDRASGQILWKTMRANRTRSYCVPIIRNLSGRVQMILSGDKSVASYDPNTGQLHWILPGPTEQFVASIVYNPRADLLFVSGGYPELHVLGLKHDGQGTIGSSQIDWRSNKGVSYVPSPVSVGDLFFLVSDGGIATCFDAATGTLLWQERLPGGHHASLLTAEDRVYFTSDRGVTTVVEAAPRFRILASNDLGEKTFASPAISQGDIYIRTEKHLFCISQSSK